MLHDVDQLVLIHVPHSTTSRDLRLVTVGSTDELLAPWSYSYDIIIGFLEFESIQRYCDGAAIMRRRRHVRGMCYALQLPRLPNGQERRPRRLASGIGMFGKVYLIWWVGESSSWNFGSRSVFAPRLP